MEYRLLDNYSSRDMMEKNAVLIFMGADTSRNNCLEDYFIGAGHKY